MDKRAAQPTTEIFSVPTNEGALWTEAFGSSSDPAVVLISGMTGQAIRWDEAFCCALARDGFRVLRFDHRDTGQSVLIDFNSTPYSLDDMADDVIAIMDAQGIKQAHLVGSSMGGMIAQIAAIKYTGRVQTITSMLSSPITANFSAGMPVDDLPGPDADYVKRRAELIRNPPSDFEEMIQQRVIDYSLISMPPFDPQKQEAFIRAEIARARDYAASWNHLRAMERTRPQDRRPLLKQLRIPSLVIHGANDPSLPPAHAIATAEAIPNSVLLILDGIGHEFPERAWKQMRQHFMALTG